MALMDPKSILAALAKLLGLDADGGPGEADPTPEPTDPPSDPTTDPIMDAPEGEAGSEIRPTDGPTPDGENDPADPAKPAEEDPEGGPTHVDSETEVSEMRDALNTMGAENERLRTILTENGIEFEPIEGEPEPGDPADEDDEYDDEAAKADIAEQERQIAEWSK